MCLFEISDTIALHGSLRLMRLVVVEVLRCARPLAKTQIAHVVAQYRRVAAQIGSVAHTGQFGNPWKHLIPTDELISLQQEPLPEC